MKKIIVMLLAVLFAAQGIALAEAVKADAKAKAEPLIEEEMVVDEMVDPATGKVVEEDIMVAEQPVTLPAAPAAETKKV